MCPSTILTTMFAAALTIGSAALAQAPSTTPGHGDMQHGSGAAVPGGSASTDHADMMAAMERMNRDMMAPGTMTGDPDRDLVAMMMPHHQGAIDMARIYLRTGRDPRIRHMAQKIITDQERELHEMRAWSGPDRSP